MSLCSRRHPVRDKTAAWGSNASWCAVLVNLANRLLTLLNAVTNMQADGGAMTQAKSSFDHLLQVLAL